jgi:hypothetical protein
MYEIQLIYNIMRPQGERVKMRKAPATANTLAFKSRLTSFTVWTEVSGHWLEVSSQSHGLVTLHQGKESLVPTD